MTDKTPGQAAYEAWWATAEGVPHPPNVTFEEDREAWNAAAQAAIAAAPQAVEAAIREMTIEQFGDAIREGTDRLLTEKLPEIRGAAMAGARQLRAELAAAEMACVTYRSQAGHFRELLGEIGVMAANAPEDGDSFGLLEEIAMRIAAHGVPDTEGQ